VGGVYATLCPEHLREIFKNRIEIHQGLVSEVEDELPDYSLVPEWKASILFSSRGCIRRCPFCSVPQIEPEFKAKRSIRHLIYPGHKKVIFWDNNILASRYWRNIFNELEELDLEVDFNQGLDARLLTEEVALRIKRPNWTAEQLEMIAKARRVIGYWGAFPPYEGLKKKILTARNFKEAFQLRPPSK